LTLRPYLRLVVVPSLLLCGCALKHPVASIKQAVGVKPSIELQGNVAPDANANSVVPFDIAVVQDKNTAKELAKMDASTWFSAKGRCSFIGGKKPKLEFHSWEFVPGQSFELHVVVPADAKAVFGFAQYASSGPHRVDFAVSGDQTFELATNGVHLLQQRPNLPANPTFADEKQSVCPDQ
jgi:hypothetical protein